MKSLSISTAMLAFSCAAVADSSFTGTWKLNRAKQKFSERTILKIEAEGGGIRYGNPGYPSYSGPLDGSERPGLGALAKDTFTLKKTNERGYEATSSRNGKPTVREVVEVSPDGKTLTSSFTSFAPRKDGKQLTNVFTYKRIGGQGKPFPFIGNWRIDRKLTKWAEEPIPMTITESGGVLTMNSPVSDTKLIIDLDKSAATVTGASNPATDISRTVRNLDKRSFEMSTTRGPVTTKSLYRVSPDGKTMTIRSATLGDDGKPTTSTSLYERQ